MIDDLILIIAVLFTLFSIGYGIGYAFSVMLDVLKPR